MAGYSLAVQFKEYARYEYYTYDDTSKPPDYLSGKFTELYKFIPKKSSARAIKNKFIYVFQKTSGGSAYINREMKADDQGKLEIYDINNWERETNRQVKSRNHERIYFDEKSVKNGSRYYFCISQIQWSKERIRTIINQLSAGYCKRLTPLPIHKDYVSGYTDEQKLAVEYSEDYLATVYLIDYMEYVYKADTTDGTVSYSSPSLIYKFFTKREMYNRWLDGEDDIEKTVDGKKFKRAELKALNDAIWTIVGLGNKYWDVTRMGYLADIANRIATLPVITANITGIITQWENFKKHDTYVEELEVLDETKYRNVTSPPGRYRWTNAEAWLVNYKKEEREKYGYWQDTGKLIVKWIAQKEFIAMQHDYLYSNDDSEIEEIKDITGNIFTNIVDSNEGKKYVESIIVNTKDDLDRLKELYIDEIDSIYEKEVEQISRDEQLKLLGLVEPHKKEINFWTTSFFVIRKLEIGTIKMLQAIAHQLPAKQLEYTHFFRYSQLETVMSQVQETVKINSMETLIDHFPDKRYGMDIISVKHDAFEKGYYKNKYGDLGRWEENVTARLNKKFDSKLKVEIDFELRTFRDGDYYVAVAKNIVIKDEVRTVSVERKRRVWRERSEVRVSVEDNDLKCFVDSNFLNDLMVGVEIVNVLWAFSELFNNSSDSEMRLDLLNLTSAILDLSASVMDRLAKKAVSELWQTVLTKASGVLGLVSAAIEAYLSWSYAEEAAKLGDVDSESGHMLAMYGGISIAVGSIVALVAGGTAVGGPVGTVLVIAGIALQIIGNLIASLLSQDDYENWLNFCQWGKMAGKGEEQLVHYSPVPLKDWKDNLEVQFDAYNFLLFGFKTEIRIWTEGQMGTLWLDCGKLALVITPNYLNEKSQIVVSFWFEDESGKKEFLVEEEVIALNELMLNDNEKTAPYSARKSFIRDKGYIIPDIVRNSDGRIEKVMISWFDPEYDGIVGEMWFQYGQGLRQNNGIRREKLMEYLKDKNQKLKAEIYIDFGGNGQIIIPGTAKDGQIKKYIIDDNVTKFYYNYLY